MEIYEILKSIGAGSFGQVYLARHKHEGRNYVIKKIRLRDLSTKDQENTEQEVRLLQKLRHPNVVAYKDSYIDRDHFLNIVMTHWEGGDMYSRIKNAHGKKFNESQIMDWFAQMLLALLYLHERKILHRDLKTQNIFLLQNGIQLGDFGIAKVLDHTRDFANTWIGTPYYMSPELFKNRPYSYKSDVWALGWVIYEMWNLRHAFDAQSINGLAMKILKGAYPPVSPSYSKALQGVVKEMLMVNTNQRPGMADLLARPFVRKHVINYVKKTIQEGGLSAQVVLEQAKLYSLELEAPTPPRYLPEAPPASAQPIQRQPSQAEIQEAVIEKQALVQEKKLLEARAVAVQERISKRLEIRQAQKKRAASLQETADRKQANAAARREQLLQERSQRAQSRRKSSFDNIPEPPTPKLQEIPFQVPLEELAEIPEEDEEIELVQINHQIELKTQLISEADRTISKLEKPKSSQPSTPPQNSKILDRLKLLIHKWEIGLGSELFSAARRILIDYANESTHATRQALLPVLGQTHIGFW